MRLVLLLASAAALPAQVINIVDGNVSYSYSSYPTSASSAGGLGSFTASGTDHVFANWWYYCVSGDTTGSAFNTAGGQMTATLAPDARSVVLDWSNVDGRGFSARLVNCVYSTDATSGVSAQTMTIGNNTGQPLSISIYAYADFDLSTTIGNDSATQLQNRLPGLHVITDASTPATCYFLAEGAVGYQVGTFPSLRSSILAGSGGACYMLNNTGLPFGPADYTGAYQWSLTIPASGSATFLALLADGIEPVSPNQATAVPYGQAKAGTPGFPAWGTDRPFAGSTAKLEIRNGLVGSGPLVLIGASQLNLPFPPFGTVYVNPLASFAMPPFDATGVTAVSLRIARVRQGGAHFQAFWADPAAAGGIVHTEGLTWSVGSY